MEVFLIMPTSPEDRAKLSYELAKFHAEQALKMVQKLPWSTEQKLDLIDAVVEHCKQDNSCLLYTSPSPRDRTRSRMPSSA